MKKEYKKPKAQFVAIDSHNILSGSNGNPEVNVYSDETYSPDCAYIKINTVNWDDDIDE